MQPTAQNTVTRLLSDLQAGKTGAVDKLFEQVYDILRDLAQRQRAQRHGNQTLNTTALVHETYLKLVDKKKAELHSRAHFLNVAAKVMRHVLVDYARAKMAQKRGSEYEHVDIDDKEYAMSSALSFSTESANQLIALDSALKKLQLISPREANIVECRFFAGMSIVETANIMDVSPMTVKRDWKLAQAWLRREMSSE
jgi:RNA polymerase sigma factor (TIGR02999 family)